MAPGDQPKDDHDAEGIPSPESEAEAEEMALAEDYGSLRDFKRYTPAELRAQYKSQEEDLREGLVRVLAELEDVDTETKDSIRPVIEEHAPRVARRNVVYLVWGTAPYAHIAALLAVIVFPAIFSLSSWGRAEGWWTALAAVVGLLVLAFQVLLSLAVTQLLRRVRWTTDRRLPGFLIMTIVWIFLAQYVANSSMPGWLVTAIQSASWTVAALFAALIVLAQGLMFALLLLRRLDTLKSPGAEVITSILSTIFVLQNSHQKQPSSLETAATWLEDLAKVIERVLRRKIGGIDELTSEVRSISAAVRRLRRNVLLGGVEGVLTAHKALALMLVPLARGDWTALEHAEEAPIAVHWAFRLVLRTFNVGCNRCVALHRARRASIGADSNRQRRCNSSVPENT
jgi:hypothetical protein